MGFIRHLFDTLQYIRKHGWHEYREARRRYDQHIQAQENRTFRYTKKGEIAMRNAMKKRK
jgi:hypothetical protein